MPSKRKIINILLFATVLLMALYILVQSVFTEKKVEDNKSFYPNEINLMFMQSLDEYGIKKDWITEKTVNDTENDTTYLHYTIKIPVDLKIIDLLTSLNELFYYQGIVILAKELKINGNTDVTLSVNKRTVLSAAFQFDDKLTRNGISLSIIVDGIEQLDKTEQIDLLYTPTNIAFTVLPGNNSESLLKLISSHGKDYIIKIDDDIDDDFYKLNSDQHPEKIIKSTQFILSSYSKTNFVFINDDSDLYDSKAMRIILKNIPRGYIIRKKSSLINLGNREPEELKSMFRYYCEKPDSTKRIFYFNTAQFLTVRNDLLKIKKKGNNIVSPSKLLTEIIE